MTKPKPIHPLANLSPELRHEIARRSRDPGARLADAVAEVERLLEEEELRRAADEEEVSP